MLDKNYRLFGLINLVDIGLIAALIVFTLLALRFSAPQNIIAKPGDVYITYTVEIQRRKPDFAENVKKSKGSVVEDSLRGILIGTIIDVYDEPYLEDAPDYENRVIRRRPVNGLRTVYVVIYAKAQVTDYTTLIGSYEVLVGKDVYIKTRDFAAGGYVVRVVRRNA